MHACKEVLPCWTWSSLADDGCGNDAIPVPTGSETEARGTLEMTAHLIFTTILDKSTRLEFIAQT